MSRFTLIILAAIFLNACADRPPLPVSDAPLRETLKEVPSDGVIEVLSGDTIYTLANRYRVTPRRIILANNLAPPHYDLAGLSTLNVPKPRAHIVRSGDTLEILTSRYKVNTNALITLNNLKSPYNLYPGQSISIPRRLDYSLLDLPQDRVVPAPTVSQETGTAIIPQTNLSSRSVSYSSNAPDFAWPVNGDIILPFGTSARGVHNDGVNIAASEGEAVRASQAGEVAFVGAGLKAFGNLILVKHRGGWITAYAHLGNITVEEGDQLGRGQVIGVVGRTGRVDSPQLHFEIRKAREPVNPEDFIS